MHFVIYTYPILLLRLFDQYYPKDYNLEKIAQVFMKWSLLTRSTVLLVHETRGMLDTYLYTDLLGLNKKQTVSIQNNIS